MDVHATIPDATRKQQIQAKRRRQFLSTGQAYLYLLPALAILGFFAYYPAFYVFYISLFKWNFLIHGDQPFVGFANYVVIWKDPNFWQLLRTTLAFVVISVPVHLLISLGLALLLMSGIKGKALWRLAIFTPYITPLVATVSIWYWMFDRYHGLFNGLLAIFHRSSIDWLNDPHWVLPSVIFFCDLEVCRL